MSRTRVEHQDIPFNCSLAGGPVTLSREYKVLVDRQGAELTRIVAGTRCSHMDECEIATHNDAGGTSYNWSKCAFLLAEKTPR